MHAKEVIRYSIDLGQELIDTYLSDIDDANLMVRPVPGMNHVAWQLGHLIASENFMMSSIGVDMPALPDGFDKAYSREIPTSDDVSKFASKDQYKRWMRAQRRGTLAGMEAMSDEDLAKPTPESMHSYARTRAAAFNMVGQHLVMHASQWVALRRKLDKPVLI